MTDDVSFELPKNGARRLCWYYAESFHHTDDPGFDAGIS